MAVPRVEAQFLVRGIHGIALDKKSKVVVLLLVLVVVKLAPVKQVGEWYGVERHRGEYLVGLADVDAMAVDNDNHGLVR